MLDKNQNLLYSLIMNKTFEVEIASTTYRTYEVKAKSPKKAQELAL